ncbi:MAG: hypothetical protein ACKV2V_28800 [Blastocatellia bacterium]
MSAGAGNVSGIAGNPLFFREMKPAGPNAGQDAGRDAGKLDGAREFARALDRAGAPREDAAEEERREAREQREAPGSRTAERSRDDRGNDHEDDQQQDNGPGLSTLILPAGENGKTDALAILPPAGLQRMLVTIRTQLTPGGMREVLMDLHESVLQGLRVRLTATPTGRLTADFMTSDARVKTLLDTRAAELGDLLRAQGVNLAAVRTSLEPQANGQGQDGSRHPDTNTRRQNKTTVQRLAAQTGAAPETEAPPLNSTLWRG